MSVIAESFIVGTVGNIYELRQAGARNTSVIDFSVAVTPRVRNGDTWSDGETVWVNATAWGRLAENMQQSFNKGDRIMMQGRWTNKQGYTRDDGTQVPVRLQFVAEFIGVDIFFDPAKSMRQARGQIADHGYAGNQGYQSNQGYQATPMPVADTFSSDDFNQPF